MTERIYVDFNSRVAEDKIIIPLATAKANGSRYHVSAPVTLYDEELEVEARLEYSSDNQCWIGVADWSMKHLIS
jgi:hypothetical protein